jgi:hypothetical protein
MKKIIGISCVLLSALFFTAALISSVLMLGYGVTGVITEIKSETTSFYNVLYYVAACLFFQLPGVILFIFGLILGFIASSKLS